MCSRAELALIAVHLEPRKVSAGTTVIYQGQAADRFYLLCDGVMHVTRLTGDGYFDVLARLARVTILARRRCWQVCAVQRTSRPKPTFAC